MRNVSDNGLRFTAAFESFRSAPYFATADERAKGLYTWGFGHTGTTPPRSNITLTDAYTLLKADMAKAVAFADANVSKDLNQAQFDAICDLCFNVGKQVVAKDAVLGDFDDAARDGDVPALRIKLLQFNKQNGVVLPGLVRRAAGRSALFDGSSWSDAEAAGRAAV